MKNTRFRASLAIVGTTAALGGAAIAGIPALADDSGSPAATRTVTNLRVVPFDTGAVKAVGAASAPIGLPIAPSPATDPTPVVPGGPLVQVKSAVPDLPGLADTGARDGRFQVNVAVQLSASEAAKQYDAPGIAFRVVYRASVKGPDGPLLVEVIEPSISIANREFEAPGNIEQVDGQTVYNAESAPGVSFATTVAEGGRFAIVSGPGTAATRLALLRNLGFAK